jgi:hypothetical protein
MKNNNKSYILLLFISLVVICGCKKSITDKSLQYRGDLAYEVNAEKPYSGEVLEYYGNENKKIKAKVCFKDGRFDGTCTFYHENGQISEEYKYENGKKLESKGYYDNGQLAGEKVFSDGKLVKMSSFLRNGEKELIIENDLSKDTIKFAFMKGNNEIDKTAYYLNAKIFPMMSFIEMSGKSPSEIIDKFGKVDAKGQQQGVMVTYDYRFYRADDSCSGLINKAAVSYHFFKFFKNKNGSMEPALTQITYYNKTEKEKMEIMTEADKYLLANGFVETKKNEFKSDKFIMGKTEVNNNFSYIFYRNKEK